MTTHMASIISEDHALLDMGYMYTFENTSRDNLIFNTFIYRCPFKLIMIFLVNQLWAFKIKTIKGKPR